MKTNSRIVGTGVVIGLLSAAGMAWGQHSDADHAGHTHAQPPQPVVIQPAPQPGMLTTQAPSGPPPKIVITKMEHDFGRMSDESEVKAEFPFKNEGTGPLIFKAQPRASCGCTAGTLDKLEYAPGEGGVLSVKFNPRGKHGDQNLKVLADTNDPAMPVVTCTFHALVRQTITIDPPLVGFGEVLMGQPATQLVKVRGPKDFAVTYASNTKGRFITTRVVETRPTMVDNEEGSESVVEFTLHPGAPRGTVQALATARTTNEKHPLVDLQITAEVVGDLQVLPPRLNVGVLEGSQQFTKAFRVSSRTGKPFTIKSVEQKTSTMPGVLMTTISAAQPGSESAYQIDVQGMAPPPGTPIMATLAVVMEQDGVEERADVQVQGVVRMPAAPGAGLPAMDVMPGHGVFQPPAAPAAPARDQADSAGRPPTPERK
ncbi:MAG: DUF1573 domain-containing protein [Phycisphaerales bacterium]